MERSGYKMNSMELLALRHFQLSDELQELENQEKQLILVRLNLQMPKIEVDICESGASVIGEFEELLDESRAIVKSSDKGKHLLVKIHDRVNRDLLKPSVSVIMTLKDHVIIDILENNDKFGIKEVEMGCKPNVTFDMIGGLHREKEELIEALELPLTDPTLFRDLGIEPPRGILLYGPPGCGKTMLAKAISNRTNATFFQFSGSEFVNRYVGEGAKKIREVFKIAKERAPSIIFIDEIDAIASKRSNCSSGGAREVNRILIELLNCMDGFVKNDLVNVIMATNRPGDLDPALLRPGRLDKKIKISLPDVSDKLMIFRNITNKMQLADDVNLNDLALRNESLSAADIESVCREAALNAIRQLRRVVTAKDFSDALKYSFKVDEMCHPYLYS